MDHFVLVVGVGLSALQMAIIAALLVERRKKREEERGQRVAAQAAEEALREADRRKDLFLAMLAHELRNPINSIRMASALMRVAPKESDKLVSAPGVIT